MRFLVFYILFCVVAYALVNWLDIAFINPDFNGIAMLIWLISIPLCILASLFYTLSKNDSKWLIVQKVVATLFVVGIVAFGLVTMVLSLSMCGWNNDTEQLLYRSKAPQSVTIVQRKYWCLFGGNEDEKYVTFKRTTYGNILVRYKEVDANKLNRKSWVRVKN